MTRFRGSDRKAGFCLTELSVMALIVAAVAVSALLWLMIWMVL